MELNKIFPFQVCINLEGRVDRWQRMQRRFEVQGLNGVKRFPALEGCKLEKPIGWNHSAGAYGCLRSHLSVVEKARLEEQSSVLIFEDDTILAVDFNERFEELFNLVPKDWDMLFFGAIHGQPLFPVSKDIVRVTHSLSTFAYAIRESAYDAFIELNRNALTVLDENTRALQKRFNAYCFLPHLAWVERDCSDVRNERVNLWWLEQSFVLFGPHIDELLRETQIVIDFYPRHDSSIEILNFTIDYLLCKLPGVSIAVRSELNCTSSNIEKHPAPAAGGFPGKVTWYRRESSRIKDVLALADGRKQIFVLLDQDVFVTRDDIKANLLTCRSYDAATGFTEIRELDVSETKRVMEGNDAWQKEDLHPRRRKKNLFDSALFITRKALKEFTSLNATTCEMVDLPPTGLPFLRVFESPNDVRRLKLNGTESVMSASQAN